MRKEEEGRMKLLDERITSIQQSRDLLQQRSEQQSFEISGAAATLIYVLITAFDMFPCLHADVHMYLT
jgi:hypothetical protein